MRKLTVALIMCCLMAISISSCGSSTEQTPKSVDIKVTTVPTEIEDDSNQSEYTVEALAEMYSEYTDHFKNLGIEPSADETIEFWNKYDLEIGKEITIAGTFFALAPGDNGLSIVMLNGLSDKNASIFVLTEDESFAECKAGDPIIVSIGYFSNDAYKGIPFTDAKLSIK